jgi:serine/threonine-protein kinase
MMQPQAGSPTTHRDALPGESRYELLLRLASGGMGTVYVARRVGAGGFQRLCAVKRAHAHLVEEPKAREMLLREAKLASAIHHPNVVAVQDVEQLEHELLLAMEYVEGASLAELISAEPLDELTLGVALRILLDVGAGLVAVHGLTGEDGRPLGIVHRDVSPQNILVSTDGIAKVTDFGVAKANELGGLTRTGVLKGKLAYMAPEYAEGRGIDERADVFALGVVAWELLTKRRLFRGDTDSETLVLLCQKPIASPSEFVLNMPPALDAVVMKALARRPEERYANVAAFIEALERVGKQHAGIATHEQVGAFVLRATSEALRQRRELLRAALAKSKSPGGSLSIATGSKAFAPMPNAAAPLMPPPRLMDDATIEHLSHPDLIEELDPDTLAPDTLDADGFDDEAVTLPARSPLDTAPPTRPLQKLTDAELEALLARAPKSSAPGSNDPRPFVHLEATATTAVLGRRSVRLPGAFIPRRAHLFAAALGAGVVTFVLAVLVALNSDPGPTKPAVAAGPPPVASETAAVPSTPEPVPTEAPQPLTPVPVESLPVVRPAHDAPREREKEPRRSSEGARTPRHDTRRPSFLSPPASGSSSAVRPSSAVPTTPR